MIWSLMCHSVNNQPLHYTKKVHKFHQQILSHGGHIVIIQIYPLNLRQ